MSDYDKVRISKIKKDKKSKKNKSKKRKAGQEVDISPELYDAAKHGGWWKASLLSEIKGNIAIQFGDSPAYIKAFDEGSFTAGALHEDGEGPSPEEVLTAIPAGNDRIALKSGYGKYLTVDSKGNVKGIADAVGPREQWEPIFQDNKMALLSSGTSCFIGRDDDDDVIARSITAGPAEMISIRCQRSQENESSTSLDEGKVKDVELSYVKMFQKFQDKKIKLSSSGHAELVDARKKGKLHEQLLDRRSKMKSDRYCK